MLPTLFLVGAPTTGLKVLAAAAKALEILFEVDMV